MVKESVAKGIHGFTDQSTQELKSWKLVHLMVKTGDDIKQGTGLLRTCAMQLINRFQYIFKEEKLDCVVFH